MKESRILKITTTIYVLEHSIEEGLPSEIAVNIMNPSSIAEAGHIIKEVTNVMAIEKYLVVISEVTLEPK